MTDQGLNKGTQLVFELVGAPLSYIKIKVFLQVNAQLCWLDNVSGVPRAHFSLLLIAGFGTFLQAPALASH